MGEAVWVWRSRYVTVRKRSACHCDRNNSRKDFPASAKPLGICSKPKAFLLFPACTYSTFYLLASPGHESLVLYLIQAVEQLLYVSSSNGPPKSCEYWISMGAEAGSHRLWF
uniref:Uncharacterized protein n=1 Tax=Amazona collaria TaxID=241587 RepID=A0A8B9GGB4_9PSIT